MKERMPLALQRDLRLSSLPRPILSPFLIAGEVGLATLKRVATIDATLDLDLMIQYLEVHDNQEYLVKRIRTLAKGGCMSSFNSSGGDCFKVSVWFAYVCHFFVGSPSRAMPLNALMGTTVPGFAPSLIVPSSYKS